MKKIIAGCVLALCMPFATFALNKANSLTLTLGGGYVDFADKRHLENTNLALVAVGYNVTPRWGLEVLAAFFNSRSGKPEDNNRQVSGNLLAFDVLYRFLPFKSVFVPYVLGGVGATGLSPNGFDPRNEGNINAGVGLQTFISENIAFRLELRDFYTITGGKNDLYADVGVMVGLPL